MVEGLRERERERLRFQIGLHCEASERIATTRHTRRKRTHNIPFPLFFTYSPISPTIFFSCFTSTHSLIFMRKNTTKSLSFIIHSPYFFVSRHFIYGLLTRDCFSLAASFFPYSPVRYFVSFLFWTKTTSIHTYIHWGQANKGSPRCIARRNRVEKESWAL